MNDIDTAEELAKKLRQDGVEYPLSDVKQLMEDEEKLRKQMSAPKPSQPQTIPPRTTNT